MAGSMQAQRCMVIGVLQVRMQGGGVWGVQTNPPFSLWDMSQSECSKSAIALISNA